MNTWQLNSAFPTYSANPKKLFALFLLSFLQARLEEFQSNYRDNQEADIILNEILNQFGLKLNVPFQFSVSDMLDSFTPRAIKPSIGFDNNSGTKTSTSRMTIDYSKFLRDCAGFWRCPQLCSMVRLCKLPESLIRHGNRSNGDISTGNDNEEHSLYYQFHHAYTHSLYMCLRDMWLHYNFDTITSMFFDMSEAHRYLPLSIKLANIQTLYLSRPKSMANCHLENTVLFIKQNRAAFPNKRTLDFKWLNAWCLSDDKSKEGLHDMMDLSTYIVKRKKCREDIFQYMSPAISIYEAVKRPSAILATNIPNFYEHAMEIELDRLKVFEDEDLERTEQGEGQKKMEFLRRCENLSELYLGVDSHDVLSWIVSEARDSVSVSRSRPLRNLKDLGLWSSHSYNSAIQVFNDAMIAFSTSLQSIILRVSQDYDEDKLPIVIRNARTMRSLQQQQLTSATSIGDWTCYLPWLRAICIDLEGVASIKVGSFKQCPNLETLKLGFYCQDISLCRLKGIAPSSLPETGELLDPRWAQAEMDYTLFPIWNLPRLKQLELIGMAALRFDLRSLLSAQRLESLTMDSSQVSLGRDSLEECIPREHSILSLQLSISPDYKPGKTDGIHDSDSKIAWELPDRSPSVSPSMDFFSIWSLPKLRRLELYGMAALGFEFKFLIGMQCLDTLNLNAGREMLSGQEYDKYIAHQYQIPVSLLCDESCYKGERIYELFESDSKKAWILPELRTMDLSGPPADLFYLDLLKSLPKLESLTITNSMHQKSSISMFFGSNYISQQNSTDKTITDDFELGNAPNSEGCLRRCVLTSNLPISTQDITRLLTIYAPFLEVLALRRFHVGDFENGYEVLEAIKSVDNLDITYTKILGTGATSGSQPRKTCRPNPGQKLTAVCYPCSIDKEQQKKLELQQITHHDKAVFNHYGLRYYDLSTDLYVRQKDFDFVKNNLRGHKATDYII
ncbi:hypothetical protein BGZ49_002917 [Haplosporangium sp. Z 27]|nr:hypothetical protein BGZ49_002917 [Haplosporangium sp. Z 27]